MSKTSKIPTIDPEMTPEEARELLRRAGPGPIIVNAETPFMVGDNHLVEKAPVLFTIDLGSSSVTIHKDGIRLGVNSDWNKAQLLHGAMAALPLILERERDRALYEPDRQPISLDEAVAAIREAIEDGDSDTVDAAGNAIAELVRFIGQADDDDAELAQAIAHERKRAQAEEAQQDAASGVAEGLIAAGTLGPKPEASPKDVRWGVDLARKPDTTAFTCYGPNGVTMCEAYRQACETGMATVRLSYGHGEGVQVELVSDS